MTDQHTEQRRDRRITRRRLVYGAAVSGAVAAWPGAVTAQTDGDDETITLTAALPSDAPMFGTDDYTGLFVQIEGQADDADASGIDACTVAESVDEVQGFDVRMFDRTDEDAEGETTTLFVPAENEEVDPGQRYIVNNSQPCGDYVEVELEQLHTEAPATVGTTETTTPGFGVLAAVGGIAVAAAAWMARGDADDPR